MAATIGGAGTSGTVDSLPTTHDEVSVLFVYRLVGDMERESVSWIERGWTICGTSGDEEYVEYNDSYREGGFVLVTEEAP